VREYQEAQASRQDQDLSPEAFAVFWLLKRERVAQAESVAHAVAAAFDRYPHWQRSADQEREVRKALYKALIDGNVDRVVEIADRLMTMLKRASA
jgi:type I restriction enzyme, R subunit